MHTDPLADIPCSQRADYKRRTAEANVDRVDDGAGGCRVCGAEDWMWCDRVVHQQRVAQDPGDEDDAKPRAAACRETAT